MNSVFHKVLRLHFSSVIDKYLITYFSWISVPKIINIDLFLTELFKKITSTASEGDWRYIWAQETRRIGREGGSGIE